VADEQLSFIIADLKRFTALEVQSLALDIQANLQIDTPRDTGWARANWVPSIGAPHVEYTHVQDPQPTQVASAVSEQAEAVGSLLGYTLEKGAIFTTNNVPYIIPLNEGHSPQAGAGFVQRAAGRALRERDMA
jgi:hypothetical protein